MNRFVSLAASLVFAASAMSAKSDTLQVFDVSGTVRGAAFSGTITIDQTTDAISSTSLTYAGETVNFLSNQGDRKSTRLNSSHSS